MGPPAPPGGGAGTALARGTQSSSSLESGTRMASSLLSSSAMSTTPPCCDSGSAAAGSDALMAACKEESSPIRHSTILQGVPVFHLNSCWKQLIVGVAENVQSYTWQEKVLLGRGTSWSSSSLQSNCFSCHGMFSPGQDKISGTPKKESGFADAVRDSSIFKKGERAVLDTKAFPNQPHIESTERGAISSPGQKLQPPPALTQHVMAAVRAAPGCSPSRGRHPRRARRRAQSRQNHLAPSRPPLPPRRPRRRRHAPRTRAPGSG